ncbi:MAG TPA: DUF2064 domain-containing protein [Thermoanaerobaculia bacterium]|nr:DUF2064 domain-containing protein [Thermoanaerobaculia bacterium]
MKRTAVVLFARSPEREAAAKGMRFAAPLFRRVIAAWLESASRAGATPLIACEEADLAALAAIAPSVSREWLPQRGASFGERVANASSDALSRFDAIVLAAIDAPPPACLASVLQSVAAGATVVAPARDGGINFIAFSTCDRELLSELTLARCRERIGSLVVLDAITDVDSRVALDAARHERAWRGWIAVRIDVPLIRAIPFAPALLQLAPRAPPA